MLRALSESARALGLLDGRVLVACSGGVDSTVLLHALVALRGELRLEVVLGHVDHGLRADSAEDAAFVVSWGEKLGVAVETAHVDPRAPQTGRPSRVRPTLQEAARRERYRALSAAAERLGARWIVTAHTVDDQAETVLLRLLRGSGPDGLGGIPERSPDGRILRPLLGVTRSEILSYARAEGLGWREDPSNAEGSYARNRLRHEWLPGLAEAFNPQLLRAVADLAEAARRDGEWIAERVEAEARVLFREEGAGLWIAAEPWSELPEALARRLVREALRRMGGGRDVARIHLLRCLEFLRGGRPGTCIQLPGGLVLRRSKDGFQLAPAGVEPRGSC